MHKFYFIMKKIFFLLLGSLVSCNSLFAAASWQMTSPSDPQYAFHQVEGYNAPTSPSGEKVIGIASTVTAFAAVLEDGTIQCWGNSLSGGITPTLPSGTKVIAIASTFRSFAAILEDVNGNRTIQCWGEAGCGGSTPTISSGVVSIASTTCAFAAILEDGTIKCWGGSMYGGKQPTIPSGEKVVEIDSIKNNEAFSAILEDVNGNRTTQCWGGPPPIKGSPF